MNLEGFSVSFRNTVASSPACFFSISMWILLEETKAISIPEKNAESTNVIIMMTSAVSKIRGFGPFDAFQIVSCSSS